jgi:hypothetical protein
LPVPYSAAGLSAAASASGRALRRGSNSSSRSRVHCERSRRAEALRARGGNSFPISEELAELASGLIAAIGKEPLTGIVLDASDYPSNIRIAGIAG